MRNVIISHFPSLLHVCPPSPPPPPRPTSFGPSHSRLAGLCRYVTVGVLTVWELSSPLFRVSLRHCPLLIRCCRTSVDTEVNLRLFSRFLLPSCRGVDTWRQTTGPSEQPSSSLQIGKECLILLYLYFRSFRRQQLITRMLAVCPVALCLNSFETIASCILFSVCYLFVFHLRTTHRSGK